jgi:hypothetical protein
MGRVDKEKKLKIFFPLLVLIAVFIWVRALAPGTKEGNQKDNMSAAVSSDNREWGSLLSLSTQQRQEIRTSYTSWGRNPFVLKEESDGQKTSQRMLNGIFWDEGNPKALINDMIVGIGDQIGQHTVIDIKQNYVILSDGTNKLILKLGLVE